MTYPGEKYLVKYRFNGLLLLAICLLFSAAVQGQPGPATAKLQSAPGKEAAAKTATVESIRDDIREALTLVEGNHVTGRSLNYGDVVKISINGALGALDPHSNYFDAKENEQFRTDQSSRYYGVGATIGDLSDAEGKVIATYIKATFDGAPAHRAGLRYGDKIVDVNGVSMVGKSFSEVRSHLPRRPRHSGQGHRRTSRDRQTRNRPDHPRRGPSAVD